MTFDEYIKNPMGKNNAVYSQRGVYKDLYTQKFDTVLVRDAGRIMYTLYKDSDKRYLIHLKIPSELIGKFYYDVVIEYITSNTAVAAENNLNSYETKFFSNDPAFVFTHAHAFNKNKMFIEDLKEKMSSKALTDKAVIKNPKDVIGYVKQIYFAYLYIKLKGLDKKVAWLGETKTYSKEALLFEIDHADQKVAARQAAGENLSKKKPLPEIKKSRGPKNTGSTLVAKSTMYAIKAKAKSNVKSTKATKYTKTTKRK